MTEFFIKAYFLLLCGCQVYSHALYQLQGTQGCYIVIGEGYNIIIDLSNIATV